MPDATIQPPTQQPVQPTSLRHYLENDPPELDPVLVGLFDRGDKLTIVAPSKSRKSFFVLQMLICLATGRDFLQWYTPQPRRVLLLQYEVKECHLWRRARRMCRAMGVRPEEIGDRMSVANLRGKPKVCEFPEECEVVANDPLYKMLGGAEENDASAMAMVLGRIDEVVQTQDVAAVIVHHDAKGRPGERANIDRGAGSGVLARDYDAGITLTPHKTEDDCFVVRTTLRNYPPIEDFTIRWVGQFFELAPDVRPDVETNKTVANAAQRKPSPKELADYSKQWLADGPVSVTDYKDRLALEFDVGVNLAGRASTQLARLDGYAKWQDSGSWWIGLESNRPPKEVA
ncbi:MAG: AAA family ATPase [Candidatus Nealsonbacteria bacterium]|nr:AAA family ATPase [Candidatus Nealsonbacteria bacterium]